MTPEERKMLVDLHHALMEDQPNGDEALIRRINRVCKVYERASWSARGFIWLVTAGAVVASAWFGLKEWILRGGGP